MSKIKTIKVKDENEQGFIIVNECDMTEDHAEYFEDVEEIEDGEGTEGTEEVEEVEEVEPNSWTSD